MHNLPVTSILAPSHYHHLSFIIPKNMNFDPKQLPLGLVTRIDEHLIYIWTNNFGHSELKYPLAAIPTIKPGDRVRFYLRDNFTKIQSVKDLYVDKGVNLAITKLREYTENGKTFYFKIITHVIFPPIAFSPYQNYVGTVKECRAMAFSPEFGRIACFQDIEYKAGVVYKASISRIPKAFEFFVSQVETLFTFVDLRLAEEFEKSAIERILDVVPWRKSTPFVVTKCRPRIQRAINCNGKDNYNENLRKKLSILTAGRTSTSQKPSGYGQHKKSFNAGGAFCKPPPSTASQQPYTGIVVHMEESHTVIWSRQHGNVFAPQSDCLKLSDWVSYHCLEDHQEGKIIRRTAYALEDIKPPRLSYKLKFTVQVFAEVKLDKVQSQLLNGQAFVIANDNVLGRVLCSRDEYLMSRLVDGNVVEVLVMYTEGYKQRHYKWIAFAVNKGVEDWRKLTKLPDTVDQLASSAFAENSSGNWSTGTQESSSSNSSQVVEEVEEKLYYQPPPDWTGTIPLNEKKISEVLGVVVEREDDGQMAVIYTQFGLARHQNEHPKGTWVKVTIVESPEEDIEAQENIAENYSLSFYVIKCQKIAPPMSTRVISFPTNGKAPIKMEEDRILMCGIVQPGGRCLENQFLGIIQDNKNRVKIDLAQPPSPHGYLVEIGLLRKKALPKQPMFMQVVKFHGRAQKNVNCVSLEDSYIQPVTESASIFSPPKAIEEEEAVIINLADCTSQELSAGPSTPSTRLVNRPIETIRLEDDRVWFNLSAQDLLYHQPNRKEKMSKSLGLIVKKQDTWALVYSKMFGVGLLRAMDCLSAEDQKLFAFWCQPGKWIGITYIPAVDTVRNKFKYMCLPQIEPKEDVLLTRVENNVVQAKIDCDLSEATVVQACAQDPSLLQVTTALGSVLLSEEWYRKHGSERLTWVAHTAPSYDCHWTGVLQSNPNVLSVSSKSELCGLPDDFSIPPTINYMMPMAVPLEETELMCEQVCSADFLLESGPHSSSHSLDGFETTLEKVISGEKAYGEPFYSHLPNNVYQKIHQGEWNQSFSLASMALNELQEKKKQQNLAEENQENNNCEAQPPASQQTKESESTCSNSASFVLLDSCSNAAHKPLSNKSSKFSNQSLYCENKLVAGTANKFIFD